MNRLINHFKRLLDISYLMLTDSGGAQEKAPALGKPVLVMRETIERPEVLEAGTAKLLEPSRRLSCARLSTCSTTGKRVSSMARAHNRFGDGHSSQRICDLLASG